MRKVFALFAGLVLLSMLAACSDESTPTPPKPPATFEISTAAVPVAYTCSPYSTTMEASGGTAPYTWTLAAGSDPLPEGIALATDGRITGVMTAAGDFSFTVRVTDSSPTPKTAEKAFDMSVDVPSNPSMAIFFDGQASVCTSNTAAMTPITCYVYIMLDDATPCAESCEFKIRMTGLDGVDLEAGSQFVFAQTTFPDYVSLTIGQDLSAGVAVTFGQQWQYGPDPILVASFELWLLEDLQNLSFKFDPNPGGYLAICTCAEGYPIVNVTGREAALNFATE